MKCLAEAQTKPDIWLSNESTNIIFVEIESNGFSPIHVSMTRVVAKVASPSDTVANPTESPHRHLLHTSRPTKVMCKHQNYAISRICCTNMPEGPYIDKFYN